MIRVRSDLKDQMIRERDKKLKEEMEEKAK